MPLQDVTAAAQSYGDERAAAVTTQLTAQIATLTQQISAMQVADTAEDAAFTQQIADLVTEVARLQAIIDGDVPDPDPDPDPEPEPEPPPPTTGLPVMGSSVPDSGKANNYQPLYGGYNQWDGIRVYNSSTNSTGGDLKGLVAKFKPKAVGYSHGGQVHLGTAYGTTIRNLLVDFYEGVGSADRKNVKLYIGNGNEYADKVTTSNVPALREAMKAAYAAVHEVKQDGTRRYPNAYLGMDPTHYQEKSGIVARTLMEITEYLDFVAWSTYPPGRESTSANPTFTKPGTDPAAQGGHIERCIQRTVAVQTKARQVTGQQRIVEFQAWETGIGDDPNDKDHRPYYAAHSIAKWTTDRCKAVGLACTMLLWWNQEVAQSGQSQNVLSDEKADTNPSTATAWRNWKTLTVTKPSNWPSAPKSSWPTGA